MSASRFDPKEGEPYARCLEDGCGFVAETEEQMSAHTTATMKSTGEKVGITASSHSYRKLNPSREDAIRREVMNEADDALESALEEFVSALSRLHTREGVTLAELTAAVKSATPSDEWAEAWAEYVSENEDEEDDDDDPGDGLGPQLHQETALFDAVEVTA